MVKAVVYCRVSTEDELQVNALEKQIDEAKAVVINNNWTLVDTYIDEGKTGTSTKKRKEYLRLFNDLDLNKFDIIVVKSQDRLFRSARDWYFFIDKLVTKKIRLFFYLENRFYTHDDTLLTGIRAILAEEYSRDLSKKINNMHRNRQNNLGNIIITSNTWGYTKEGKNVIINEQEAKVVRQIFDLCIMGHGSRKIANILTESGVCSRTGNSFSPTTVRSIIQNPLFKGTQVMNQKHFDFNTKKTIKIPEENWIYKENAVPPIVTEEVWEAANLQMKQRSFPQKDQSYERVYGRKVGTHPLSTKIVCGNCGAIFWQRNLKKGNVQYPTRWTCSTYIKNGKKHTNGCTMPSLSNDITNQLLSLIITDFQANKEKLMEEAFDIISTIVANTQDNKILELKQEIEMISLKREQLLDKFLNGVIAKDVYQRKDAVFAGQIEQHKKEIKKEEKQLSNLKDKEKRLSLIKSNIADITSTENLNNPIYYHIERIVVYSDKLVVEFDLFPTKQYSIKDNVVQEVDE